MSRRLLARLTNRGYRRNKHVKWGYKGENAMIIVMGHAKLGAGEIDRLAAEMEAQITATRAEDGCLHYGFSRDVLASDTLVISERWRDNEAIAAHFASPHMAVFNAVLAGAKVLEVSVKAYENGEERTLMGR